MKIIVILEVSMIKLISRGSCQAFDFLYIECFASRQFDCTVDFFFFF